MERPILELLNEIQCPVVRERALSQWDKEDVMAYDLKEAIGIFSFWDETNEGIDYWDNIEGFIGEHGNITFEQSYQFEELLPEDYQGNTHKRIKVFFYKDTGKFYSCFEIIKEDLPVFDFYELQKVIRSHPEFLKETNYRYILRFENVEEDRLVIVNPQLTHH